MAGKNFFISTARIEAFSDGVLPLLLLYLLSSLKFQNLHTEQIFIQIL